MRAAVGWCIAWNSERGLPARCATTCTRQCIAGMNAKWRPPMTRAIAIKDYSCRAGQSNGGVSGG